MTTARFTVRQSALKFDGDSRHATLDDAQAEFDRQRSRRDVGHVELAVETDYGLVMIKLWSAIEPPKE